MYQTFLEQKFIALFVLITVFFGIFPTSGQINKTQPVSNQNTLNGCKSGYSGTVRYTKTVTTSSSGKFGSTRTMKRVYQTNILIRDDGKPQGSVAASTGGGLNGSFNFYGQAESSENENLNQLDVSEKDEYCNLTLKGAGKAQRVRCESRLSRQSQSAGTTGNANVFIGLRGRTMVLSISNLPRLNGSVSQESSSNCSGTCTPQKPVGSSSSVEIKNGGESSASTDEGVIQFNPESFNRLSGSWTRSNNNTTETFEWNLSRCARSLEIADIRFEHKRVPDPKTWYGIDPQTGTIDGNIVKIKARVFNNGGDTAYANVRFSETKSAEVLPDSIISVAIKPGEFRDVEYEWDTSGYAWNENQKKESEREIKAELEGGNTETAKIKIKPKPVVMVHGLWSNEQGWANYPIFLRNAHSYDWEGFAVGSDPKHGKMNTGDFAGNWQPTNTIFQNSQELGKQIKYVRESKNAWHIDIVAHSMGGLISRHYIHNFMQPVYDGKPEAAHLVMLGTPNQGSPCAYTVDGLFGMFGVEGMMAIKELRPYSVNKFNAINTNRKGVKFSILAGYTVRTTCHEWGLSDGVVQLPSALYNISDRDYSTRIHTELTGKDDFEKFVLPRLAVGPKKARTDRLTALLETIENKNPARSTENDRYGFNWYFQNAAYKNENRHKTDDEEPPLNNVTSRQKVVLSAKQTKEIEIPSTDANKTAGILLVATTAVSATLTDASGAIVGKSEGGLEALKNPFRTIIAEKPVNGNLKLKLENFDSKETTVFVAGFTILAANAEFTVEAGKPNPAGTIPLIAKLTQKGTPILGAKITANVVGQTSEITFFDDGKHGDGNSNDGIYGASLEKPGQGEFFVEAKTEINNQIRLAVAVIKNGTSSVPVKTVVKPRKGK